MNVNEQRFLDLALKAIARQASDAEQAELDALLARQPEWKAEFDRLQQDARLAQEVLPLLAATGAQAGELPAYAKGRLQTKVRQTLGKNRPTEQRAPKPEQRALLRWWHWLGLAAATAAVVLLVGPLLSRSPAPVIQVALLDTVGQTRGTSSHATAPLRQAWEDADLQNFSTQAEVDNWLKVWPPDQRRLTVKVLYDRDAGHLRVLGHRGKKVAFENVYPVDRAEDITNVLEVARAFIESQVR